jgi:hypothetical protein
VEEVSYYMSLEQSPVGGLRMSHKQWLGVMRDKNVESLESHPVPPEVQKKAINWLLGLNALFSLREETKTLVQDIIDARMGGEEEETKKKKEDNTSRWEVIPLESIDFADLDLDLDLD